MAARSAMASPSARWTRWDRTCIVPLEQPISLKLLARCVGLLIQEPIGGELSFDGGHAIRGETSRALARGAAIGGQVAPSHVGYAREELTVSTIFFFPFPCPFLVPCPLQPLPVSGSSPVMRRGGVCKRRRFSFLRHFAPHRQATFVLSSARTYACAAGLSTLLFPLFERGEKGGIERLR